MDRRATTAAARRWGSHWILCVGIVGVEGVAMLGNGGEISRCQTRKVDKNVVVVDLGGKARVGEQLHGVL
jgi:hypothetical protein